MTRDQLEQVEQRLVDTGYPAHKRIERALTLIRAAIAHPPKGTEIMSERTKRRLSPEEFRMARRELELTQTRLGQLLGVSTQAVARWEKGQTAIPVPAEALTRIMLYQQRGSSTRLTDLLRSMTAETRP
jgi:DNA-binding transcriptional regulator YiaG